MLDFILIVDLYCADFKNICNNSVFKQMLNGFSSHCKTWCGHVI